MKTNVGTVDRIIRILMAIGIIALVSTKIITGTLAIFLGVVAAILLLTAIFKFCAIYRLFGMTTCSVKQEK